MSASNSAYSKRELLGPLLCGFALLSSFVVGYLFGSGINPLWVGLSVVGALSLLLMATHPAWRLYAPGIVLMTQIFSNILFGAYNAPPTVAIGSFRVSLVEALLIAGFGLTIVDLLAAHRPERVRFSLPVIVCALLLLALSIISAASALSSGTTQAYSAPLRWYVLVLIVPIAWNIDWRFEQISTLARAYRVCCWILLVGVACQRGGFPAMLGMLFALAWSLSRIALGEGNRKDWLTGLVFFLLPVIRAKSLITLVYIFAMCLAAFGFSKVPRRVRYRGILLALAVALAIMGGIRSQALQQILGGGVFPAGEYTLYDEPSLFLQDKLLSRVQLWVGAFRTIAQRPFEIRAVGFLTYVHPYTGRLRDWVGISAHNVVLDILLNLGMYALPLLVYLLWRFFTFVVHTYDKLPGPVRTLFVACVVYIIGMLASVQFGAHAFREDVGFYMWAQVGLVLYMGTVSPESWSYMIAKDPGRDRDIELVGAHG